MRCGALKPLHTDKTGGTAEVARRKTDPMNETWSKPVTLHGIGEDGEDLMVDSTRAASWAMIEDWPVEDGEALDKALLVCANVANGKGKDEEARKAFIEAAIEAGIKMTA